MTALDRLRYGWNNSAAAPVTWGHRLTDPDARRHWPAQTVRFPDAGASLLYAGLPQGFLNVLPLVRQLTARELGPAEDQEPDTVRRADLHRPGHRPADLVAVGCRDTIARRLPAAASLVLPFRLHLIVDVPADPDEMRARISKSERWRFSRDQRRTGWTTRISHDPADFTFFYHRMHVPTMDSRHGENKRTERPEVAFAGIFARGFLFLVEQDGRPVAGVLCGHDRATGTVTTRLLGVLDGADEHYDSGAFRAVYHHLLRWCAENGVAHLDLYGTEAFIGKGIFRFKRLFRPRLALPPNHFAIKRLWWRATADTPAVRRALAAMPVVAMTADDQLEIVYFHDDDHPPRHDLRGGDLPGVTRTRDVHLDEFLAPVVRTRPAVVAG